MPCIKGKLTPQSFMSQMNPIGFFSGFQITVTYFVFAVRPPRSYLNLSDYVHIMDAFCFLMIHTDMDVFPKAGLCILSTGVSTAAYISLSCKHN